MSWGILNYNSPKIFVSVFHLQALTCALKSHRHKLRAREQHTFDFVFMHENDRAIIVAFRKIPYLTLFNM